METFQNGSDETFQAVLLDPSYYTTPTGDGEILIQYKEFNNTSFGSYDWDQIHGDYCTVGIEDHTMTRGLQYTFNNTYHPAAMQLSDERSILITTRGSDLRMEGDLNYDQIIDVYDLMLMVDESAQRSRSTHREGLVLSALSRHLAALSLLSLYIF